jgi:FixJ family two-component response regulator
VPACLILDVELPDIDELDLQGQVVNERLRRCLEVNAADALSDNV